VADLHFVLIVSGVDDGLMNRIGWRSGRRHANGCAGEVHDATELQVPCAWKYAFDWSSIIVILHTFGGDAWKRPGICYPRCPRDRPADNGKAACCPASMFDLIARHDVLAFFRSGEHSNGARCPTPGSGAPAAGSSERRTDSAVTQFIVTVSHLPPNLSCLPNEIKTKYCAFLSLPISMLRIFPALS